MTTTADMNYITQLMRRLGRVRHHVHTDLKGVLYELGTTIEEVGTDGILQAHSRKVEGPSGLWTIGWLISGDRPWVTLQWPRRASSPMIDFMCSQALRFELAVHRPETEDPWHDRLWIPLSAQ